MLFWLVNCHVNQSPSFFEIQINSNGYKLTRALSLIWRLIRYFWLFFSLNSWCPKKPLPHNVFLGYFSFSILVGYVSENRDIFSKIRGANLISLQFLWNDGSGPGAGVARRSWRSTGSIFWHCHTFTWSHNWSTDVQKLLGNGWPLRMWWMCFNWLGSVIHRIFISSAWGCCLVISRL